MAAAMAPGCRVVVRGESGAGKTALLIECAEQLSELPTQWWLPGGSLEALLFELANFGRRFGPSRSLVFLHACTCVRSPFSLSYSTHSC